MGLFKTARKNFIGISNSIENTFETFRSIENNNNLRKLANGGGNRVQDADLSLQVLQQELASRQNWKQERDLKRRNNIMNDPELKKQVQAKRAEILEKTGRAVPVDDIIDIYFSEALDEDGLTPEEAKELAEIQKQYEDEEEAQID